ncbi:MAG: hypothetical protein ACJ798_18245 [Phenylobacterium sp.]
MAQTFDGDWAGSLTANGKTLNLQLHIKTDANGSTAALDAVEQGVTIPASAVKTEGRQLSILFLSAGGELTGKLSPDGTQIVGSWNQGADLPLTLTKKPAK